MDRPHDKLLPLFRVAVVVFALLMIGGYAVAVQFRTQRETTGSDKVAASRSAVASTGTGEVRLDRVSLTLRPRRFTPSATPDPRPLVSFMDRFDSQPQTEVLAATSKSGTADIAPIVVPRMLAAMRARGVIEPNPRRAEPLHLQYVDPEQSRMWPRPADLSRVVDTSISRRPGAFEMSGLKARVPPEPTPKAAAGLVVQPAVREHLTLLHPFPRPTPWQVPMAIPAPLPTPVPKSGSR